MRPREVLWRGRTKLRDWVDACLASHRRRPVKLKKMVAIKRDDSSLLFAPFLPDAGFPNSSLEGSPGEFAHWRDALLADAEKLCRNQLSLFDLQDLCVGSEINWNYEYKARKNAPVCFSAGIDYRDHKITGDCKFVWEPNRHQHWVRLARAYRLTGRERYLSAILRQMESWMAQCPFGLGMNWRSPLELGIRLINWTWTLQLVGEASVPQRLRERLIGLACRHLWEISRKYSRYSSANNHRIGEAAGVFIGSSYFRGFEKSAGWRAESRRILEEEIAAQTHPDGGTREQAMGYHLFVLEFFLLAGLVARFQGEDFSRDYWRRIEAMLEFLRGMQEGGDHLPMFGDCDDGYVLDLGSGRERARDLLCVGGIVLRRSDLVASAGGYREPAMWLLGAEGYQAYRRLSADCVHGAAPSRLACRSYPYSGYYLLQYGDADAPERVSVTFDCGQLGMPPLAAHGHADALSITVRVGGHDLLVDPGTYDYFTYRQWREYFRSTKAHNTVVVDGRSQSEPLGLFLWGQKAEGRLVNWSPMVWGGTVTGEHDGYAGLGVVHRRSVSLDGRKGDLEIRDTLEGKGRHTADWLLHFGEAVSVVRAGAGRFLVRVGAAELVLECDPCLETSLSRGEETPMLGWVSRGYHRKVPSTTLTGRCCWADRLETVTRLSFPNRERIGRVSGVGEQTAAGMAAS